MTRAPYGSASGREQRLLEHVRTCEFCQLRADTRGGYELCGTAMEIGGEISHARYVRVVETVRNERLATAASRLSLDWEADERFAQSLVRQLDELSSDNKDAHVIADIHLLAACSHFGGELGKRVADAYSRADERGVWRARGMGR